MPNVEAIDRSQVDDPRLPRGRDGSGASIRLKDVTRRFGSVSALDGVNLDIAAGEFMTLLGASGSGKSTMLSLIAGFDNPTEGVVEVAGQRLNGVPPYRRNIGMVFQNYALFPHMSVADNVGFSLHERGVGKSELRRRVSEVLEVVELSGFERRRPTTLSGGQQQRVALARAIVFRPQILLLDEPMAALDKRLREQLQIEIKRIHAELGITFVFVTHDQEEALAMSDRIAVVRAGRVEQLGSVDDIYERPLTPYIADFVGESNLFDGNLRAGELRTSDGNFRVAADDGRSDGTAPTLMVRPEKMNVHLTQSDLDATGLNTICATVKGFTYLGSATRVVAVTSSGRNLVARVSAAMANTLRTGEAIWVSWAPIDGWLIAEAPASSLTDNTGPTAP